MHKSISQYLEETFMTLTILRQSSNQADRQTKDQHRKSASIF